MSVKLVIRRADLSAWCAIAALGASCIAALAADVARGDEWPSGTALQEVVVTAQKRTEALIDAPVPVSVISGDYLFQTNQLNFRDYFNSAPGLSMQAGQGDTNFIAIRGITTSTNTNPTVGLLIDDAPYSSSTVLGGGGAMLEVDPSDVERIEVLRGPQGTLYGGNSMGGLIKYVLTSPSLNDLSGKVDTGINSVKNDDQSLGYSFRGSVNAPVGDTVAVLASAYSRRDPGFIDNPTTNSRAINSADAWGTRLGVLWKPSDDLSIKFNLLHQYRLSRGADATDSLNGHLSCTYCIPQLEGSTRSVTFSDLTLNARLGNAELTAVTSYTDGHLEIRNRVASFDNLVPPLIPPGDTAVFDGERPATKFTQEVRALVPITQQLEWLVGGFYTSESGNYTDNFSTYDLSSGQQGDLGGLLYLHFDSSFRESAVFTDLTVKLGSRFEIQLGGRQSWIEQSVIEALNASPAFGGDGSTTYLPTADYTDRAFTYLVTPQFKLTDRLMAYARIASGYRPGGPNYIKAPGVPDQFTADTTKNYEVGIKGELLHQFLSVDASIYRIDWNDIQLQIYDPTVAPISFIENAGSAKSQGIELTIDSTPFKGLNVSAWGAWNDATLKSITPGTLPAVEGNRLPYSPRFSGSFALDYQFHISGKLNGATGASLNYVGDRLAGFSLPTRVKLPSYSLLNIHAGIRSNDGWDCSAFVTNVTDKRGYLDGDPQTGLLTIAKPRTVGLAISRAF